MYQNIAPIKIKKKVCYKINNKISNFLKKEKKKKKKIISISIIIFKENK